MLRSIRNPIEYILAGVLILTATMTLSAWSQEHDHNRDHKQGDLPKAQEEKEVKYLFGNHQCPAPYTPSTTGRIRRQAKQLARSTSRIPLVRCPGSLSRRMIGSSTMG